MTEPRALASNRPSSCEIRYYEDTQFDGDHQRVTNQEVFFTEQEDLHNIANGDFDSDISSIRFIGDCRGSRILLYEQDNFQGAHLELSGNYRTRIRRLSDYGWNDRARSVKVHFNNAPKVALHGDALMELTVGDNFVDPGYHADDYPQGFLDVTVTGSVDTATPGVYNLTYYAIDEHGKEASATRIVVVTPGPDFATDWSLVEGTAIDIGAGADGSVWVVAQGRGVFRRNGSTWDDMGLGGAARIDVGPNGDAWVVMEDTSIRHWTSGGWETIVGHALDIGVGGDGSVWVIALAPTLNT